MSIKVAPGAPAVAFLADVRMHLYMLMDDGLEWLRVAAILAPPLVGNTVVVTSLFDGEHSAQSFHYVGRGGDTRWKSAEKPNDRLGAIFVPPQISMDYAEYEALHARYWAERCERALRGRWQVVLEPTHVHYEGDRT